MSWRSWAVAVTVAVLLTAALYAASEYGESKIENHENSLIGLLMPELMPEQIPDRMGETK